MTDDKSWASPSGASPVPGTSPWARPESASPSAAGPGATWQQQAAPVWTPPPKPGLIPLRPLSFGTIIGSSFRVMRRNPAPTFGLSVLLYALITVGYLTLVGTVFAYGFERMSTASPDDQSSILAGTMGSFALVALVPAALGIVASAILQGIISLEVSRATLGEKLKIRGLWRLAKGRLGALIRWAVLQAAALLVLMLIASGVTIAVFAALTSTTSSSAILAGAVFAVLITALVVLVFVVLSVWLGTKLSLVPSVILLERLPVREAMRRSWYLTKGNFWRTFGIEILIAFIVQVASSVITTPITLVGGILATLVNPNSDATASAVALGLVYLVAGIVGVVLGAIGLVMQSASLALIYIDIRMRKEGLDLELLHYVEAKQSGTPGVANPYLTT